MDSREEIVEINKDSDKITIEEFMMLVKQMRTIQRRYERYGKDFMNDLKIELEGKVDQIISDRYNKQMRLW